MFTSFTDSVSKAASVTIPGTSTKGGESDDLGIPENMFVEQPVPGKYKCGSCSFILRDPVVLPCGHSYCKKCVLNQNNNNKESASSSASSSSSSSSFKCPIDEKVHEFDDIMKLPESIEISKELNELHVYCRHKSTIGGCKESMLLGKRQQHHDDECGFSMKKCPFEKCDVHIEKQEIENHITSHTGQHSIWLHELIYERTNELQKEIQAEMEARNNENDGMFKKQSRSIVLSNDKIRNNYNTLNKNVQQLEETHSEAMKIRNQEMDEKLKLLDDKLLQVDDLIKNLTEEQDMLKTKVNVETERINVIEKENKEKEKAYDKRFQVHGRMMMDIQKSGNINMIQSNSANVESLMDQIKILQPLSEIVTKHTSEITDQQGIVKNAVERIVNVEKAVPKWNDSVEKSLICFKERSIVNKLELNVKDITLDLENNLKPNIKDTDIELKKFTEKVNNKILEYDDICNLVKIHKTKLISADDFQMMAENTFKDMKENKERSDAASSVEIEKINNAIKTIVIKIEDTDDAAVMLTEKMNNKILEYDNVCLDLENTVKLNIKDTDVELKKLTEKVNNKILEYDDVCLDLENNLKPFMKETDVELKKLIVSTNEFQMMAENTFKDMKENKERSDAASSVEIEKINNAIKTIVIKIDDTDDAAVMLTEKMNNKILEYDNVCLDLENTVKLNIKDTDVELKKLTEKVNNKILEYDDVCLDLENNLKPFMKETDVELKKVIVSTNEFHMMAENTFKNVKENKEISDAASSVEIEKINNAIKTINIQLDVASEFQSNTENTIEEMKLATSVETKNNLEEFESVNSKIVANFHNITNNTDSINTIKEQNANELKILNEDIDEVKNKAIKNEQTLVNHTDMLDASNSRINRLDNFTKEIRVDLDITSNIVTSLGRQTKEIIESNAELASKIAITSRQMNDVSNSIEEISTKQMNDSRKIGDNMETVTDVLLKFNELKAAYNEFDTNVRDYSIKLKSDRAMILNHDEIIEKLKLQCSDNQSNFNDVIKDTDQMGVKLKLLMRGIEESGEKFSSFKNQQVSKLTAVEETILSFKKMATLQNEDHELIEILNKKSDDITIQMESLGKKSDGFAAGISSHLEDFDQTSIELKSFKKEFENSQTKQDIVKKAIADHTGNFDAIDAKIQTILRSTNDLQNDLESVKLLGTKTKRNVAEHEELILEIQTKLSKVNAA